MNTLLGRWKSQAARRILYLFDMFVFRRRQYTQRIVVRIAIIPLTQLFCDLPTLMERTDASVAVSSAFDSTYVMKNELIMCNTISS